MVLLVLGLVLFLGPHAFTMNRTARGKLIGRIGEGPYKGVYSVIVIVGVVLIVYGYGAYRETGMVPVWDPPFWTRHLTFLLVLLAFVSLAASYGPSHIRAVVKHPMILAVILWSLGHLLVRGDLGSILLFGGFLLWGVTARWSMALRAADDRQGPPPVSIPRCQADIIVVVVGVALYAAFLFWLHPLLIGVRLV